LEALAVIWAPVRTLMRVAEERRVLLGFSITALYAALGVGGAVLAVFGGLTQAQFQPGGQELPPELRDLLPVIGLLVVVWAVVSPFILWLLVSGLMHLVTRFFGGTGPFSGTLAVVGVAQIPFVIAGAVQIPITGLQIVLEPDSPAGTTLGLLNSLLGLAALVWFVALVVIGAAFARRVGYGQSAGSCAISCAGCAGLILVVAVAFGVLAAILSQAASAAAP
jgi:hypothetical protein